MFRQGCNVLSPFSEPLSCIMPTLLVYEANNIFQYQNQLPSLLCGAQEIKMTLYLSQGGGLGFCIICNGERVIDKYVRLPTGRRGAELFRELECN